MSYKLKDYMDLEFTKHHSHHLNNIANIEFSNGYGVSVLSGEYAYTDTDTQYELAIRKKGKLCYTTGITDDVIGYLSPSGVSDIMKQVQQLRRV